MSIDERQVRERAHGRCEYCRIPQSESLLSFVVDHIIARQHGGGDEFDNLALAYGWCNLSKGPNIAGVDPETRAIVQLFNPRTDRWEQHFACDDVLLVGRTAIGRATIATLGMNQARRQHVREILLVEGLWP